MDKQHSERVRRIRSRTWRGNTHRYSENDIKITKLEDTRPWWNAWILVQEIHNCSWQTSLQNQSEINCVLMLNWRTGNRTVLTFILRTYAKLNCSKKNCFDTKTVLMLNWIAWILTKLNWKTELLEIERFLTIKLFTHAYLNCLKNNCLFV